MRIKSQAKWFLPEPYCLLTVANHYHRRSTSCITCLIPYATVVNRHLSIDEETLRNHFRLWPIGNSSSQVYCRLLEGIKREIPNAYRTVSNIFHASKSQLNDPLNFEYIHAMSHNLFIRQAHGYPNTYCKLNRTLSLHIGKGLHLFISVT